MTIEVMVWNVIRIALILLAAFGGMLGAYSAWNYFMCDVVRYTIDEVELPSGEIWWYIVPHARRRTLDHLGNERSRELAEEALANHIRKKRGHIILSQKTYSAGGSGSLSVIEEE